jgi:hypothetical protein
VIASINWSVHQGDLTCVGNSLTAANCFVAGPGGCLSCVGFDNGLGTTIFQVTVVAGVDGAAPSANYSFVELGGQPERKAPQTAGPWPCTVSPTSDSSSLT